MAYDEYGNYYVEGDYREQPGLFSRMGSGIARGARNLASGTGRFVTSFANDLPNLYRDVENWAAGVVGYQQVAPENQTWYNRYEPVREPFSLRNVAAEIPTAIAMSMGAPGGASAVALRSVKPFGRQLLRTGVSYAWNRGFPVSFWKDAIQQGDYAAAVGDTNAFIGANLGGRFISGLPFFLGGGKVRNLARGASTLAGGLGLGYGGYAVTRPFQDFFGGSVDRFPLVEGKRVGNSVFQNGVLVYEPLPGVDPYYDFMNRGTR